MFVIKNVETGKYVAPSGSQNSYTSRLEDARTFATLQEANAEACGNERALAIESLLHRPVR